MRKRLVWFRYNDFDYTKQSDGISYKICYKHPLEEELEPTWMAYRCENSCEIELYSGYNLAKAIKSCELNGGK